ATADTENFGCAAVARRTSISPLPHGERHRDEPRGGSASGESKAQHELLPVTLERDEVAADVLRERGLARGVVLRRGDEVAVEGAQSALDLKPVTEIACLTVVRARIPTVEVVTGREEVGKAR